MDSARAAHSEAAETADSEAGGRCQLGFTLSVTWQLRGIHRFSVPLLLTGPPWASQKTLRDGFNHAWKPPPSLINAESIHEPTPLCGHSSLDRILFAGLILHFGGVMPKCISGGV